MQALRHLVARSFQVSIRAAVVASIVAVVLAAAPRVIAKEQTFQDIQINVIGTGTPVLMIPGLNSAGAVWTDTCAALQPAVQCHIVQLPGFAGQPAVNDEPWLHSMRDRLLAYVDQAELKDPAIVGHSLGGVLGMQLVRAQPTTFRALIIVDSLPFYPAIQNPSTTEASIRPMAEGMRAGMLAADEASYQAQARMSMAGMSNQAARMETLTKWGGASDRWTTAQAMFELMTIDLREAVAEIKTPTLVLGAWAGYAAYGSTADSVRGTFETQYAKLPGVQIKLSEGGYHFLMWDDQDWLVKNVQSFLAEHAAK